MLDSGVVCSCSHTEGEFISPIFLVPKADGSKRFILNLKKLNCYVDHEHFKIEDMRVVKRLVEFGSNFASIDIQDAYWHVPIHSSHRKYLRFNFQDQLYEFMCLPFGLSSAPRAFTKLMKPVVSLLRQQGLMSVIYLDDLLLLASTWVSCNLNVQKTIQLLNFLGFTIKKCKSCLFSSQKITFLGFELNSINGTIRLPLNKH